MKYLFILGLCLFSTLAFAQNAEVHLVAKIKSVDHHVEVTQNGEHAPVLFRLKDAKLEQVIKNLKPEDE